LTCAIDMIKLRVPGICIDLYLEMTQNTWLLWKIFASEMFYLQIVL